jgi:DoxX-like protein
MGSLSPYSILLHRPYEVSQEYAHGTSWSQGNEACPVSKGMLWTGHIISALPALVLLVDGAMKVGKPEVVVKTTVELGYAETVILPLGLVLLACMTLYLIPRTAVLGAILLTGYCGRCRGDARARRARTMRNLVSRRARRSPLEGTGVTR